MWIISCVSLFWGSETGNHPAQFAGNFEEIHDRARNAPDSRDGTPRLPQWALMRVGLEITATAPNSLS
jgi:hypothetical protein